MRHESFLAFRERKGWTRKETAEQLDIDRTTQRKLEAGERPIPRHIALACAALEAGLEPLP